MCTNCKIGVYSHNTEIVDSLSLDKKLLSDHFILLTPKGGNKNIKFEQNICLVP